MEPLKINLNPASMKQYACKCGCTHFVQSFMLRIVPKLFTPDHKPGFIALPQFICGSCGSIAEIIEVKTINPTA